MLADVIVNTYHRCRQYGFAVSQLIFLAVSLYWITSWSHLPPPGWAVALLALAAALMSIHQGMGDRQKIIWIAVMGLCFVTEIRAIIKDRQEATALALKERSAQDLAFKQILDQEIADFKVTESTLKDANKKSQEHFETTINAANEVLAKAKVAAKEASEGVANLTGGDSYVVVFPVFISVQEGTNVFRVFAQIGKNSERHILQDVTIMVRKMPIDDSKWFSSFVDQLKGKSSDNIAFGGTILPRVASPLSTTISPDPSSVTSYFINATTRSKSIIEVLQVRYIKSTDQWQYSYEVKEVLSPGVSNKMKVLEVTEPFWKALTVVTQPQKQ